MAANTIDPCRLGIIIADVSGKGIGASLLMASVRAALHSEMHPQLNLAEMTAKLNDFVHRSTTPNQFITFFFGELNTKTNELRYVNAGHNPPFLIKKGGEVSRLETSGFCLGMFPSVNFEPKVVELAVGEMAVFYTDGITEGRNIDNQEFGEQGLISLLKKNLKQPASKVVEKVCAELTSFTSGTPPMDDMTFIAVKRTA